MNVFLAHPKGHPERELAATLSSLRERLGPGPVIVRAIDDFRQRARATGSWAAWGRTVVERFDRLVIVQREGGHVGRGTAALVSLALERRVPLELVSGRPVLGIVEADADDWKHGWALAFEGDVL